MDVYAIPLMEEVSMMTKKGESPKYAGPTPGEGKGRGGQEERSGDIAEGTEESERSETAEWADMEPPKGGRPQEGTAGEGKEDGVRKQQRAPPVCD